MKNKLTDLNDHLFLQLERINDEDIKPEELEKEIKRSQAVSSMANQIISNASLALRAEKLRLEYNSKTQIPAMINGRVE